MEFRRYINEAINNVLANKIRAALTILGILVGTASVVALVSGGELATRHALAQFKALGTNLLAISINEQQQGSNAGQQQDMTLAKTQQVVNAVANVQEAAPYTTYFGQISYAGKNIQGSVIGATKNLQSVMKIQLAKGRFVSMLDKNEFFCVIGANVAKTIHQQGTADPIGKQILVGKNYFTIVGIAKHWPQNIFMISNVNNSLIIPIDTSLLLSKYTKINNIIFKLAPDSNIQQTQDKLKKAILAVTTNKRLFARSPEELIQGMQKQRKTLTLLLGFIGGISLVVGGIGVMNIMLVSVIERRREIGVRMAIGAKRRDIQLMFLAEAIVLTLFGGLFGVIIGETISLITAEVSKWGFHLFILPPLIGFSVSAITGIFFGFYPARKASQLDPIEALTTE